MSSTPPYLRLLVPRAGAVAPNAAIVLEAHAPGGLVIEARVDGAPVAIAIEQAHWLAYDRFRGPGALSLVRPQTGEWPRGGAVVLDLRGEQLEARIATELDLAAPAFASLAAPALRTMADPRGDTDVVAIDHGPFDDAASPIVIVTLELGAQRVTGAVAEGRAGTLTLARGGELPRVDALTVADVAGNARRIVGPCDPASPFVCVAGSIEATSGGYLASTDGGSAEGFSRGHYLTTQLTDGDLDLTVTATRLTDEHEMPLELAFRGGFFGVTGTSSWYLYEHAGHWTGWQPTPRAVGATMVLRVIQRGKRVDAYVNHLLAGTMVLERPVPPGGAGIAFKGRPGAVARMRVRELAVRPVTTDPRDQPRTIAILIVPAGDPDAFEAMSLEDRRYRGGGWDSFALGSGRYLDTFFMKATQSDLGVFAGEPELDGGGTLVSCLIDHATLLEVLPVLEALVDTDAAATAAALHAHGGGTGDRARITAALASGTWPTTGDAAEEAAAFARRVLVAARAAIELRMGVCWEYRGQVVA